MKRWALLVVVLYMVAMAVVSWPIILAEFDLDGLKWRLKEYPESELYIWPVIIFFALLQAALLVVPVRIAGRRPISKRWVFWPLLGTIVATLCLGAGMLFSVAETIGHTEGHNDDWMVLGLSCTAALWVIWTFIFGFYSGVTEPKTMMSRLTRGLMVGSILELLVVIPAHIIARMRDYCCAGFWTFAGLCAGIAVALLAFGPGFFMLIVRRYASLKPSIPAGPPPLNQPQDSKPPEVD